MTAIDAIAKAAVLGTRTIEHSSWPGGPALLPDRRAIDRGNIPHWPVHRLGGWPTRPSRSRPDGDRRRPAAGAIGEAGHRALDRLDVVERDPDVVQDLVGLLAVDAVAVLGPVRPVEAMLIASIAATMRDSLSLLPVVGAPAAGRRRPASRWALTAATAPARVVGDGAVTWPMNTRLTNGVERVRRRAAARDQADRGAGHHHGVRLGIEVHRGADTVLPRRDVSRGRLDDDRLVIAGRATCHGRTRFAQAGGGISVAALPSQQGIDVRRYAEYAQAHSMNRGWASGRNSHTSK